MTDNPFWDFSLDVYAQEGVAEACLRLQDKFGYDVNLLLFALWAGRCRGAAITESDWRDLIESTRLWREDVIRPLRRARRALKTASLDADWGQWGGLRQRVQDIELECERVEQDFLLSKLGTSVESGLEGIWPSENFHNLSAVMGVSLDALAQSDFKCVLDAAAKIDSKN
jgi:uncharacterized protein (TIGR02444 family)